ncbi:Shedu anti-phage system protein SduA domain-containing protein [Stigmatella hybrida]|uniref:Shedu anti-phage system protein SduA domain-containing protein n=1 Tax=Stigmatella hybrida TaxID=394097 RepID=UPI001CDA567C|nr:Shedu anti-phage system protein SduA domain-containing protein [Stigmatella hybrida]
MKDTNHEVHVFATIRHTSADAKRAAFMRSGNRCAFPGCDVLLLTPGGAFIGEICHIEALTPGGPRYNAAATPDQRASLDNLIVLCPNHHRMIDAEPDLYTVAWLRQVRDRHANALRDALTAPPASALLLEPAALRTLKDVLAFWEENKHNSNEEFWQSFFYTNPNVIAQAFPDSVLKFKDKCYVGGKSIDNRNGNLLDFLYRSGTTKNVVLVEIKTPTMRLLGKQYRGNAYAVSEDLSGAIVQVLNYREELLKSFYMLAGTSAESFTATAPRCVVLGGSLAGEQMDANQCRSFELFRWSQQTIVLTYDDLFAKIKDIVDLGSPPQ